MAGSDFKCVIFDLDGVVTATASVHAKAWKETFDEYMRMREKRDKEPFKEFTHESDYLKYVDGKPRYDGVANFLESRNISIPKGESSDSANEETVCGLGNKKNEIFLNLIKENGAEVYKTTVEFIKNLKKTGIRIGVASSSRNCKLILESTGLDVLFETRVDGVESEKLGLKGKPEGDIFVTAAHQLGCAPFESAIVEDASSGVMAGRNGGFSLVIGIARKDNENELLSNCADIVVRDLADVDISWIKDWFQKRPRPVWASWEKIEAPVSTKGPLIINPSYFKNAKSVFDGSRKIAFFFDYDGTLTPIVSRPELAILGDDMKKVLMSLSEKHLVSIVSGRMREDVQSMVGIKGINYVGSHGFDILMPGRSLVEPRAQAAIPVISNIVKYIKAELDGVSGVIIEDKKFSTAIHYRLVEEADLPKVKGVVQTALSSSDSLRCMEGKKVFEIMPDIDWDKGKAIKWVVETLGISWSDHSVVYIGDDVTDEYAFRSVRVRGTGILVSDEDRPSSADFILESCDDVRRLIEKVI